MKAHINNSEQTRLEALFLDGAMQVDEFDEHWVHNHDEGESYCFECATKKVKDLLAGDPGGEYCVDGGWETTGDSTPFCEVCFKRLSNELTEYGCESEVEHFLMYGFNPMYPSECLDMYRVVESRGWNPLPGFSAKIMQEQKEYFDDLHRLCRIILDQHFWIMPDNDFRHMWK